MLRFAASSHLLKRAVDVVASCGGLVLTAPIVVASAILVRIRMGPPAFFFQERSGYRGQPFRIAKLRTMLDATDGAGTPLPDEARLTGLGRFLRESSIDELPQLWNILRGDMSLVGPRPLPVAYHSRYSTEQARRLEVRPGLTGWAQVRGRNAISWDAKFALDVWYIDNRSLLLDAQIILETAWRVIARRDISNAAHATMPEFKPTSVARTGNREGVREARSQVGTK